MMVGAFTASQSNRAAKGALGLTDPNDILHVMSRIRQLCLEHIGNIYTIMIDAAVA